MRKFVVRASSHGKGLFATREINANETILQLRGRRISYRQVLRLVNPDNALQIGPNLYVDLKAPGVFANHSCHPNSGVTPELNIIALRKIRNGEEICYDYSATMDAETECDFRCECGYARCRKRIGGFTTLSRRLQRRYRQKNVVQSFLLHEMPE